jgi:hypothetical protein
MNLLGRLGLRRFLYLVISLFFYWGGIMHQSHNNQKSCSLWKCVMGLMAIVFLLGAGATLAQAAKGPDHSDLRSDHANLAIEHGGLDQKLDQVLEDISNLGVGAPLCGAGTEGERFVVNGPEVCDNTTGLYWEQSPTNNLGTIWQGAVTHCPTLGGAYRLPRVKELLSLIDYGLPHNHLALNAGPFDNVVGGNYWSVELLASNPSQSAWYVGFIHGVVNFQDKDSASVRVWCVR